MDTLTDIRNQRQHLARYACQVRRSQARRSRKILYQIRVALKRLDRMQDLVQAEKRTPIHE
jgi:hypothetical protein